jgi:lipid-binding SYLF domain-containing protein
MKVMRERLKLLAALLAVMMIFSGFFGGDKSKEEIQKARQEIKKMSHETLQMLYRYAPAARSQVKNAYGYATFSNVGINIFLVSTENGSGLAHDNKTGKDIYMKMFSGGVGVGLGVKDFRIVFIFDNKRVFDDFVNSGWEANAQADAAAKAEDKGDAASVAITVAPGVHLYKLTKNGLALQATIQGTKYWKDDELN